MAMRAALLRSGDMRRERANIAVNGMKYAESAKTELLPRFFLSSSLLISNPARNIKPSIP